MVRERNPGGAPFPPRFWAYWLAFLVSPICKATSRVIKIRDEVLFSYRSSRFLPDAGGCGSRAARGGLSRFSAALELRFHTPGKQVFQLLCLKGFGCAPLPHLLLKEGPCLHLAEVPNFSAFLISFSCSVVAFFTSVSDHCVAAGCMLKQSRKLERRRWSSQGFLLPLCRAGTPAASRAVRERGPFKAEQLPLVPGAPLAFLFFINSLLLLEKLFGFSLSVGFLFFPFSLPAVPTQETRRSGWEFLRSAPRCNTGPRALGQPCPPGVGGAPACAGATRPRHSLRFCGGICRRNRLERML